MGAAGIELGASIDRRTVERAYQRAQEAQHANLVRYAERGLEAARARDPKLLKALEGMLEVLTGIMEEQQGRTMRTSSSRSLRVVPTEVSFVRHAYESMDRGDPLPHFAWVYGAAWELAHGVPEGRLAFTGLGSEARNPDGSRRLASTPAPYRDTSGFNISIT